MQPSSEEAIVDLFADQSVLSLPTKQDFPPHLLIAQFGSSPTPGQKRTDEIWKENLKKVVDLLAPSLNHAL